MPLWIPHVLHSNIKRCLPHLNRLTESLGWPELTPHYHNADGLDIVWYTSGINDGDASDLFLQINEHPIGNTTQFAGSVYAICHQLWTGWHSFPFPKSNDTIETAIARTDPWLNYKWFTNDEQRIQFVKQHPECTGFDWKRIGESSPPHTP